MFITRPVRQTDTGGGSRDYVADHGKGIQGNGEGNECECSITGEEIYQKLDEAGYINEIKFVDPEALLACLIEYTHENKALRMFMAYDTNEENSISKFVMTVNDLKRAIKGSTMTVKGCIEVIEPAEGKLAES